MSASLVGSEMCIRDRPLGRSGGECRAAALAPRCPCDTFVALLLVLCSTCLLYTSDAADDM
eukprot:8227534-Alexandrium_andersonii.AAC.1